MTPETEGPEGAKRPESPGNAFPSTVYSSIHKKECDLSQLDFLVTSFLLKCTRLAFFRPILYIKNALQRTETGIRRTRLAIYYPTLYTGSPPLTTFLPTGRHHPSARKEIINSSTAPVYPSNGTAFWGLLLSCRGLRSFVPCSSGHLPILPLPVGMSRF